MTVKFKPDNITAVLEEMKSTRVQKYVGDMIVDQMKDSIAAGVSPVKGERRFEKYKDPKKYPAGVKPNLPVNLYLSGDMLEALKAFPEEDKVMIGIRDGAMAARAIDHNSGTNHMPRRHFLPTSKGDELTVSITRSIKSLYTKLMRDIIKSRR